MTDVRPVSELLDELRRAKDWTKGDTPIQLQFPELCEVLLDFDKRLKALEDYEVPGKQDILSRLDMLEVKASALLEASRTKAAEVPFSDKP